MIYKIDSIHATDRGALALDVSMWESAATKSAGEAARINGFSCTPPTRTTVTDGGGKLKRTDGTYVAAADLDDSDGSAEVEADRFEQRPLTSQEVISHIHRVIVEHFNRAPAAADSSVAAEEPASDETPPDLAELRGAEFIG